MKLILNLAIADLITYLTVVSVIYRAMNVTNQCCQFLIARLVPFCDCS